MLSWDKDISFLEKRIEEQRAYIEKVIHAAVEKKMTIDRSLEILPSAIWQMKYFEDKLLNAKS